MICYKRNIIIGVTIMYLYFALMAIVGFVAGIVLAVRSKKSEGVVYGKLDYAGMVTNVLLLPVYAIALAFCFFLVMLGYIPDGEGIIRVLSWTVAIIGSTFSVLCGLGLGESVALRKKGKGKLSFLAQFAGVAGLGMTILFFVIFNGNLFGSLN